MFKGITKRWLINTFGVVLAIIILLVVCLSVTVHSLCYSTVENALTGRCQELNTVFPNYTAASTTDFIDSATAYASGFGYKDEMEIQVINSAGRVVQTSTGFTVGDASNMPDYLDAMSSSEGLGKYNGKLASGENAMAVTRVIKNEDGDVLGAVRYVSSLRNADFRTFIYTLIAAVVGLIIIAVVALSGNYFIRSIVKPVRAMSDTSKRIAQGDFSAKIDKMYDDEIGDLCDSINDMAAELDASEKLKNDFISRVSHELRTPLTAIKGWAETMQYGVPDRITLEKGMSVIVKESSRLTSLVEELLDFSKLQSGRLTMQMERMDILAEIDEAVYMLRERAISEGKHLLYDDPEEMPIIYGDHNRLKQVFLNVIDNALKYTPEGGMIGVQVYRDYRENTIKLVVADNGCGINPEDLPKVKDKFYKANQKINGSGIGLAVADEIIKMHKGSLDIESSPEVGTTVTITLPIYNEAAMLDSDDSITGEEQAELPPAPPKQG
ncbi:MAG: HAMP domain-containing histidine kinase [Ruminococcus sp.]|nr:HAMP domain-containing histidine kinase [Ruminococcus sp.]